MAEKSFPWTNNATGDGTLGGYTALEWGELHRYLFNGGQEATQGVLKGVLNELAVTGTSSPVAVNTGAAVVYGKVYQNTASVNLTVSTPAVGTTGGHVILRLDWTAQTVRLVAVRNTDGVNSTPSLTQSTSTQWEIRLATFTITTGGVIALTDARAYCHYGMRIDLNNVDGLSAATAIPYGDANSRLTSGTELSYTDSTNTLAVLANGGDPRFVLGDGGGAGLFGYLQWNSAADEMRLGTNTGGDTIKVSEAGQVTLSPASATAPIVLSPNGQGQKVTGLAADMAATLQLRRQGGSATDWSSGGTSNFTPTTAREEVGVAVITITPGNSFADTVVTFPTAFGQVPHVMTSLQRTSLCSGYVLNWGADATTTTATIRVERNGTSGTTIVTVNWHAIGAE